MTPLIIPRLTKPPGLILRALTYYLEFNQKGLYLICLGKATVQPNTHDPLSAIIANKAVGYFDKRYEKEIQQNESNLKNKGLEEMLTTKHSYFFTSNQIEYFKPTLLPDKSFQIKIKAGKKFTLTCHPYEGRTVMQIAEILNKKG